MELDVVEVAVSVGASVVVRLDLRRGKVDVHFLEFVGPVVHVLERLHYSVVLLLLVEHARLGQGVHVVFLFCLPDVSSDAG